MSNELTPQQTFEEKIKDRLRKDIGDLMPDELLTKLIGDTVKDMLKGSKSSYEMGWFEKTIKESVGEKIKTLTTKYISDNQTALETEIKDFLKEKGVQLLSEHIVAAFIGKSTEAGYNLVNDLQKRLSNRGIHI